MLSSMISGEYLINGTKMALSRINNQLTRFKHDIDFYSLSYKASFVKKFLILIEKHLTTEKHPKITFFL
jgi:hypothetical protein